MTADPLLTAIFKNDPCLVNSIIRRREFTFDPEVLHLASESNQTRIIKILLATEWLPYIDHFDEVSYTPLMRAASNEHFETIEILLNAGANINAYDEPGIGNTVLREVIEEASPELVEFLLKRGADPTIPGWMQLTAIHKAQIRQEDNNDTAAQRIVALLDEWTQKNQ